MARRLPDITDLGGLPQVSGERPVASIDEGVGLVARATGNLGEGIGKLGEGIAEYQLDKNHYEYATQHAALVSGLLDLHDEMASDKDYGSLEKRFSEKAAQLQADASQGISNPNLRQRFLEQTAPQMSRAVHLIRSQAQSIQKGAQVGYLDQQGEKFLDQALTRPDEGQRRDVIDAQNGLVDSMVRNGTITPAQGLAHKQAWAQRYAQGFYAAKADTNPQAVIDELSRPGGIHDILPPDKREEMLARARGALQRNVTLDRADFGARVKDTTAEAMRTGEVQTPLTRDEFTSRLGEDRGAQAFDDYQANVTLGRDVNRAAQMAPEEQQQALSGYDPTPGAGFERGAARQDILRKAIDQTNKEKQADPAVFAISRLPAASAAYGAFEQARSDPEARTAAAQKFAAVMLAEQERVGVPAAARTILPKTYADGFKKAVTSAADSDDPKARLAVIDRVRDEAATWGDQWPAVMRQLAPDMQPTVRAISAGADPTAMTRLLSLPKNENPAKILKEQSETKYNDVRTELNTAFAPFAKSLVGRQLDRDYPGYYGLAEKLASLYVRDGKSANDAATAAFNDLIGKRYEFRDTWRLPKSAGVTAHEVQQGTVAARQMMRASANNSAGLPFDISEAMPDAGLSDNRADSLSKFGRDGKFVTNNDNTGLNLVYDDKFVRRHDGAPLVLTWGQLAKFGKSSRASETIPGLNAPDTPLPGSEP